MHTSIESLFDGLWQDYLSVTPSAKAIHNLLGHGESIVNDHIALRTFNVPKVGLEVLAKHFTDLGYTEGGEYHFKAKKLYAKHFEPPKAGLPKVFISELLVDEFSDSLQTTIKSLVEQIDSSAVTADNFLYSGKHWQVSHETYQALLAESEYAAWMAAWGYKANHFTVSVNHLSDYQTLQAVNEVLKDEGFILNASGGEIKGDPQVLLEQSSTMADSASVDFSDGVKQIPACFYEFALRYPMPDGSLYPGFVAASADKIFESTNNS